LLSKQGFMLQTRKRAAGFKRVNRETLPLYRYDLV
jgi:hypothetical protein